MPTALRISILISDILYLFHQSSFSDIDMTAILQNALENAVHAVMMLEPEKRFIRLSISEKAASF